MIVDRLIVIAARECLYQQLQHQCNEFDIYESSAKALVHRGRRGFFRDGSRYILSALSNGGYEDQERPDGAIYHFPQSHQRSQEALDIAAAENCLRDSIPFFYVQRVAVGPARYRIFYPARFIEIDNEQQVFHVRFKAGSQV